MTALFKYYFFFTFTLSFISTASVAQNKGPHKGELFYSDSTVLEVVYPNKKNIFFTLYVFDRNLNSINYAEFINSTITFYFSTDDNALLEPRLINKGTFLLASFKDWIDFDHCKVIVETTNTKYKFLFNNSKKKSPLNRTNNASGDGHSGHSH